MSRILANNTYSLLVTYEEFALFIREEGYFRSEYWDEDIYRQFCGLEGDAVLRRIEFCWTARHSPVRGVSWFEANAYCKSVKGRLPWSYELDARSDSLEDIGEIAEWCGDWFNPRGRGQIVKPEPPLRRRVANWPESQNAVPELVDEPIGFRVIPIS